MISMRLCLKAFCWHSKARNAQPQRSHEVPVGHQRISMEPRRGEQAQQTSYEASILEHVPTLSVSSKLLGNRNQICPGVTHSTESAVRIHPSRYGLACHSVA